MNKVHGYVLDMRNRNLAEKVRLAICDSEYASVNGTYKVKLSTLGFEVLARTIQEVEKYATKKYEKERMARAKKVLAGFRKVG